METPYVLTVTVKESSDRDSALRSSGQSVDVVLTWGLFSLLVFAVLAFGTTEVWSLFMLEAGAALLFLLWAWRQILAGSVELTNPIYVPMAIFAAVVLGQVLFHWSSSPYATHTEIWKYAAYGMLFIVVDTSFRIRESRSRFLVALSFFGFLVALFAIAQNSAGNEKIYWIRVTEWTTFFGPYVNRNHYAGLMEMLAPISMAFCFSRDLDVWKKTLFVLFSIVMGTTIFLCGSRGGIIAFTLEILFFVFLLTKSLGWKRTVPAIVLFSALVIAGMVWLDKGDALGRIGALQHPLGQDVAGARLAILHDGIRMIRVHPFIGWGLGTFPDVYPQFRSFYTDFFINEAHNDYLQVFIETGLIGFIAVMAFLVLLYKNGFRELYQRGHINPGKAGVLVGCTGLLFHGLTDFNLHIPANAALFYVLCALTTASEAKTLQRYKSRSARFKNDK